MLLILTGSAEGHKIGDLSMYTAFSRMYNVCYFRPFLKVYAHLPQFWGLAINLIASIMKVPYTHTHIYQNTNSRSIFTQ